MTTTRMSFSFSPVRSMRRVSLAVIAVPLLASCADNIPSAPRESVNTVVWKLIVSPRSATMAVRDTVRLQATPINLLEEPLPIETRDSIVYSTSDSAIIKVLPDGSMIAHAASNGAPVMVTAMSRRNGILRGDTSYVVVTQVREPIARISLQPRPYPSDSARTAAETGKTFYATALTESGDTIRNSVFPYITTDSGPAVLSQQFARFTAYVPGPRKVYGTTSVYGVTMKDSVTLSVLDKSALTQIITKNADGSLKFVNAGQTLYAQPCARIMFQNRTGEPLNITFERPAQPVEMCAGDTDTTDTIMNWTQGRAMKVYRAPGTYTFTIARSATPGAILFTSTVVQR